MTFRKFSPFQLPLLSFVRRRLFWSPLPKRRNVRSTGLPETLEVRCLLSAVMSATLVDGQLTITDTDATGKDNLLSVSVIGTDLVISDANEQFIAAPAGGTLSNGDKTLTIPLSLVTERLTINGGGGADTIEVNSLGASFATDLFINGDAGADALTFQSGPIITSRNINVKVDTITVNSPLTVAAQMEWEATGDDTLLSINEPISIGGYSSFAADKMAINASIDVALGWLKLYPESTADTYDAIDIGAVGDSASNTLQLSQEELNRLTAESIFIGDYFTGPITISDSIEHSADSHFQIQTFLNVAFNSGTSWTTHNGDLRITGAGTAPGIHNFVGIDLNNATLSSSGTGIIALDGRGGSGGPSGSGNTGIHAHDGTVIESTGTGKIYVLGTGGGGTSDSRGVEIDNARITSVTGDIQILGHGGDNLYAHGIWMSSGATVDSTGSAKISIDGTGGDASSSSGVVIEGNYSGTQVSSVDGDITIIGQGGSSADGVVPHGVVINSGSIVNATGTATIKIDGTGGNGVHDSRGIEIGGTGTLVESVSGDINITGHGGNNGYQNHGIYLYGGAIVRSTGTGEIALTGFGGVGHSSNRGVHLDEEGTNVTSELGDIRITGQGGVGIDSYNFGVWLVRGASVTSTGTARIFIEGTGGSGTSENNGILLNGFGNTGASRIVSKDGDISIIGNGSTSATGSANRGFGMYQGAMIQSTGTAKIEIDGTGGTGTDSARGVEIAYAGALVTSVVGDIQITGHGGANTSAYGIWVVLGAVIESTGAAKVTVDGTGGDASAGSGVIIEGNASGTRVSSVDGDITIIGHGGNYAAGSVTRGVGIFDGSLIQSAGTAKILIDGTGGTAVDNAYGIDIAHIGTQITSATGDIQIVGHGGTSSTPYGTWIGNGAVIEATATARVTINGTGGTGNDGNGVLITGWGNGTRISAVDGDVTITGQGGDTLSGTTTRGVAVSSGAVVESSGVAKILIDGTGGTAVEGARGVEIGDSGTRVTSAVGDIQITGQGGPTAYGMGVWIRAGAVVESTATATITVTGTGGSNGGQDGGVVLNGYGQFGATRIASHSGDITITGQGGNAALNTYNRGVGMYEGAVIESTGSAKIIINGTGGTGAHSSRAVEIGDAGTRVTSVSGDIQITGQGGDNSYAFGVWIRTGAVVESTDTAKVTITGTGGSNGGEGAGVVLNGYGQFGATRIASLNGDITITGNAADAAAYSYNRGFGMYEGAAIESTGTARVIIDGTGAAATDNSRGVEISDSGTRITSRLGDIQITGQGAASAYGFGVWLRAEAVVESTDMAKVIVTGTGGSGGGNDTGVVFNGYGNSGATRIVSANGDIVITGQGGNDAANSYNPGVGVYNGSVIQSTGTAKVVINGTGGYGAAYSRGVEFADADTRVTSAIGDIQITGQAGSGGPGNNGVAVYNGAAIESTGSSKVSVSGTGGTGTHSNFGVLIKESNSWISSVNGDIQIVGGGGTGTSGFNAGVLLQAGGSVSSTGVAKIDITGTGGSGVFDGELQVGQAGVWLLDAGSAVTSKDGDIQVTGIGGGGDLGSAANHGVKFQGGAIQTIAGGSASVQVTGTTGSGPGSFGIVVDNDAGSVVVDTSVGTGNIILIANTLEITGSLQPGSINAGGQAVTIHPETAGVEIDLGGADASAKLGLNDSELDRITAGTLNIGNASSGNITVSADITRSAATNMRFVSGGDLLLSGGQIDANGGTLLLDAGASPRGVAPTHAGVDVDANLTTLDGDLSITLNGLVADTSYSQLNVVGGVNLNGVNLQLTGSFIPTIGDTFVIVDNDASESIMGTFSGLSEGSKISLNGRSLQISYVGGSDGNDVVLTAVNNVPQLSLNGGPVTFSANGHNVQIVPNLTIIDPDQSPTWRVGGGMLTMSIDVSGKLTKKGVKLYDAFRGLQSASSLGMLSSTSYENGKLMLNVVLNANTTPVEIQTFLREITFKTKGRGLTLSPRIFQLQVTDAAGAASNLLQQTINVTE